MAVNSRDLWIILRARDEATRTLRSVGGAIHGLDKQNQAIAQRLQQRGRAMMMTGGIMAASGVMALKVLNDMTNAAIAYTNEAAKAFTQTDNVATSVAELKDIGREVARTIPVPFEQVQAGLYDIFSSMDVNIGQAKMLLTEFSRAAVAGQVDLQVAGRGTIAILNAWHMKAEDVNHVNDVMFQLVRKGVGTYEEFAKSIGRAIPAAVRAGQDFEDLAGMMAFLTRNGLSTSMAATSAARALEALVNPKTLTRLDEMGIKTKDMSGEFMPLPDILRQMNEQFGAMTAPERSAALQNLFKGSGGTIQARRFFDIVFTNFGEFEQRVKEMENSAGALDEAYWIMFQSPQAKIQLLTNKYEVMKTEIGDSLIPIKMKLVEVAGKLLDKWNSLSPATKDMIAKGMGLTAVFVTLVGVLTMAAGASLILTARFGGIMAATKGVVLAMAGFKAALLSIRTAGIAGMLINLGAAMDVLRFKMGMYGKGAVAAAKFTAWAAAIAGALIVAGKASHDSSEEVSEGADKWAEAIKKIGKANAKNVVTGMDKSFDNMFNKAGKGFARIQDLQQALIALGDTRDSTTKWLDNASSFGFLDTNLDLAKQSLVDFDTAITELANNGQTELAAEGFEEFKKQATDAGYSLEDIMKGLPQYAQLLASAKSEQEQLNEVQEKYAYIADNSIVVLEEQMQAIQAWIDMVAQQDAAFVDLGDAWDILLDKQKAMAESAEEEAGKTGDSWTDFVDQFPITVAAYLDQLQAMVDAQNNWEANMTYLSGKVSADTLTALAELGPKGAPLVAALVDASDAELAKLDDLMTERSDEATNAFAEGLGGDNAKAVKAAAEQLGSDTAKKIAEELASGTATVEGIMEKYKLKIEGIEPTVTVDADTSHAQSVIDSFFHKYQGMTYSPYVNVRPGEGSNYGPPSSSGMANGGSVMGAGTSISDSIWRRLSNGEFVMRAAAVRKYGMDFMHSLNHTKFEPNSYNEYTPVVLDSGGGVEKNIRVNIGGITTQEIDPRVHAQQLGWLIAAQVGGEG
jgi:TP901 family phage tail tape measure protein